ncbi:uncharacterized protein LOC106058378 isoform X2 [Biomphalaria glabrata]|uniref:Uncharacterized protein LOC106058378 isoform X2 n=1 Tax=Biomphalaria glabrata TaxID=6526 RepID=A0A9W2YDX7_BIOGL|nr:uncharacterized protein LOC106058378 isoform X2 [Biomphalaria glabrata]
MNRELSSLVCFKKEDAKSYARNNQSLNVPTFACPREIFKNRLTKFYTIKTQNETHVQFDCLLNFHLKSGSYLSRCVNGTWSGEEPICEVDYYKDRIRLSSMIIILCLFVSLLFLGSDFCMFMKKRLEIRQEHARVRAFQINRMLQYDNLRCSAYPNYGLNDIKLYIPELQQFIGIKHKDYKREQTRASDVSAAVYDEEYFQGRSASRVQTDDRRQDKFTRGLFLFRMRSRKSSSGPS